ncbi:MAG TPA: NUDIX domain-containing protein [Polyangiales bacterium]
MPDAGDELVDVVDEQDRVLRQCRRREMRRDNLLHRVIAVMVLDGSGRIYLHRRTATKDLFPSLYDVFTAGVVGAGESYAEAARRELEEELGIVGPEPAPLFLHRYDGPETRSLTQVFRVTWTGPIMHQASEVAWGEFRTRQRLAENREVLDFVPDGREIFAHYLAHY